MSDTRHRLSKVGAVSLLLLSCGPSLEQASAQGATPEPAPPSQDVVATVNGTPISKDMLEVYTNLQETMQRGTRTDQQALLNNLINLELMAQDAIRQGMDQDSLVLAQLAFERVNILASAALRKQLQAKQFSEQELKAEYDRIMAQAPDTEYRARHILVKTQEDAEDVIQSLEKGGDFAEIAKDKSTDPSASAGGELGWFTPGQVEKPFADAVAALQKGTYTKTPVQTQYGWHVIELEETRALPRPPFDSVRKQVEQVLEARLANTYLSQLKAKADIQIP